MHVYMTEGGEFRCTRNFQYFPKNRGLWETQKSKILTPMSYFKNIYERIRTAQAGGL